MAAIDIHTPILHCLAQRARYVEQREPWAWVVGDPVLGFFAPSLHVLAEEGLIELTEQLQHNVKSMYWNTVGAWLKREARLRPILAQLDQAGIQVVPLKGAALLETVYARVGMRPMTDIDLLVRPDDLLPAAKILLEVGLQPGWCQEDDDMFAFIHLAQAYWPESLFFTAAQDLIVDLHQHWVAFHWFKRAFPVDITEVWARVGPARQIDDESKPKPWLWKARLSPYDMLAHLCLHPVFHGLQAVQSFYDIDLWIRRLPADWDWDRFVDIASDWSIRNCVYHAFVFTQALFDTPIPEKVNTALDPGPFARWQVRKLIWPEALLQNRSTLGKRFSALLIYALIDNPKLRRRSIINAVFPSKDWLRKNPEYNSLGAHWSYILRRLVRKGDDDAQL